jgi:hypothetical protein
MRTDLDRLAHPADGAILLENGHANAALGQTPRRGDTRGPRAENDDVR